jgi:hypothetical protein
MGKRGNDEGSIIRRKDGLYMARYTVQTATGTKRRILYGKTRREVDEKLTAAKAARDNGRLLDADSMTMGRYLERWLADSGRHTVQATTYETHERLMRLHQVPALGHVKLKNLSPPPTYGDSIHAQALPGAISRRRAVCWRNQHRLGFGEEGGSAG